MSPGQVEAQGSGRGEQLWEAMITVTSGMPWTSSAYKGPQVTGTAGRPARRPQHPQGCVGEASLLAMAGRVPVLFASIPRPGP